MPSPAEVEIACRVLKTIAHRRYPLRADALVLRLWAGPGTRMRPLEEIAREIIEVANPTTYPALGRAAEV